MAAVDIREIAMFGAGVHRDEAVGQAFLTSDDNSSNRADGARSLTTSSIPRPAGRSRIHPG